MSTHQDDLGDSVKYETICAIPWMHLNFEPDGKVIPCCLTSTFEYYAGDLKTQSIEEIWNSDNMKKLRVQMMNGEKPEVCVKCFSREEVTNESNRTYHNLDFPYVIKDVPKITSEDGTCSKMDLKYWDFRFSNLCNFKCRSCGPRYSSAWVPDARKLGWPITEEKVTNIAGVDNKSNFDFLKDQVQHVEKIYFAGGEPLLMDEHWKILDMLVEAKRFDVYICYNTNCSTFTYGKKNALDYWAKWNVGQVNIWPSIDELGDRAELLRSGTVWPKVENNLKLLAAHPVVELRPGITIGAWNVFRIPEIITYLTDIDVINRKHRYTNFFLSLLEWPRHYNICVLSDEHKIEITEKLNNFIMDYSSKYRTNIAHNFRQILHELSKPHDPLLAIEFLKKTKSVDAIRDEQFFEVIPELAYLKKMYPRMY
jgi:radical SAM protein with 4Fe4S-binding SPASM domain